MALFCFPPPPRSALEWPSILSYIGTVFGANAAAVFLVRRLMPLSFALGLGFGCGQPLAILMTYNRAPAGRTGEALGMRFMVVNFTHMAIPLAFGAMGSALGVVAVFVSNAALMFGGG